MKIKIESLLFFLFLALQSENSTDQLLQQSERNREIEQVYSRSTAEDTTSADDEENNAEDEENSIAEISLETKEPNEESQVEIKDSSPEDSE